MNSPGVSSEVRICDSIYFLLPRYWVGVDEEEGGTKLQKKFSLSESSEKICDSTAASSAVNGHLIGIGNYSNIVCILIPSWPCLNCWLLLNKLDIERGAGLF